MNTEAIYQAVFNLVAGIKDGNGNPVFITTDRRFRMPDQVPASEQPALFQLQRDEVPLNQKMGVPTAWGMGLDLYVYIHVPQDVGTPSSLWNPIKDQVKALFEPDPARGQQTLGGLVTWARISGKIEVFEGVMGGGDQLVAIIPVDILAPA